MKIYRVVPDSFVTNRKLESKQLTGLEDIYYKMGYTSFLGKRGYHDFNTLANYITEEGKYFYLFAEDAIQQAHSLIGGYHRLRMDTCLVVEYDFPEDIIIKHIGYGDYTEDIFPLYLIESYIGKSDLGNENITTTEIINERKIEILTQSLNDSLKRMQEYQLSAFDDKLFYISYFGIDNLDSIIDDEERIKDAIISSPFYGSFMSENGELIKSPYVTGKIIPVNMGFLSHELHGDFDQVASYYQDMGLNCIFSREQNEFKDELLYK